MYSTRFDFFLDHFDTYGKRSVGFGGLGLIFRGEGKNPAEQGFARTGIEFWWTVGLVSGIFGRGCIGCCLRSDPGKSHRRNFGYAFFAAVVFFTEQHPAF